MVSLEHVEDIQAGLTELLLVSALVAPSNLAYTPNPAVYTGKLPTLYYLSYAVYCNHCIRMPDYCLFACLV